MISEINKAWDWKGLHAIEIIATNDFGNIIFRTNKNEYWRICPEELSCEKIAETYSNWESLKLEPEFIEDWEMTNLINIAKTELGPLESNQKYCLKIPAVIGGEYENPNFGKTTFKTLILSSGDLAYQIKDLKDGQTVKLKIKN